MLRVDVLYALETLETTTCSAKDAAGFKDVGYPASGLGLLEGGVVVE